jgi:Cytochrome c554 and c-prime
VQAETTTPTSDELNCAKCHGADPFADIIAKHDASQGTSLATQQPVLCAKCHASPALGQATRLGGRPFLSEAIHGFHGGLPPDQRPACYDCHPGAKTQCSRSNAHTAADGNCTHCHGALTEVGASIAENRRVPWVNEPTCVDCHAGVPEVDTGTTLYRRAKGHGGIHCAGCHGSPHAMVPTRIASDASQMVQYQGAAVPLGDCNACHGTSRGGGLSEFGEAHGGTSPEARNACAVCHTVVPGTGQLAQWPHGFGWKTRSIEH